MTKTDWLKRSTDELPVGIRAFNGLLRADVKYVVELVQLTEKDLLKRAKPGFGLKSLEDVKITLADFDLSLGMKPPSASTRKELDAYWMQFPAEYDPSEWRRYQDDLQKQQRSREAYRTRRRVRALLGA